MLRLVVLVVMDRDDLETALADVACLRTGARRVRECQTRGSEGGDYSEERERLASTYLHARSARLRSYSARGASPMRGVPSVPEFVSSAAPSPRRLRARVAVSE